MKIQKYKFNNYADYRGNLIALEECIDIPFAIKRVFYIFGVDNKVSRGKHANKRNKEILICLRGSCEVLLDDGFETKSIMLNNSSEGLYISNNIWLEINSFSSDALLLVVCSELYDEDEYIRDYNKYIEYIKENDVYV